MNKLFVSDKNDKKPFHNIAVDDSVFKKWTKFLNIEPERADEYIVIAKSFVNWAQNTQESIKIDNNLFERWVAYLDIKPASVKTYTKSVRLFINWLRENNITQPTKKDIINYRDQLKSTLEPTTINTYIASIKAFFSWLSEENIYANIAEHVKGLDISVAHKKDYLTAEDIKKILDNINQDDIRTVRDYAMLASMSTCGLRTIEVTRFNVCDIRTIKGCPVLYTQRKGKDDKSEYVKLVPQVFEAIKKYLDMRMKIKKYEGKDALFASISNNNIGNRLSTKSVSEITKNYLISAGYSSPRLTAHSLRHSAATINLEEGGTIEDTQMLLGHSSPSVTSIYDHYNRREKNNSEQRIANAIFL